MIFGSAQGFGEFGRALLGAALLLSACAGKAEQEHGPQGSAGSTSAGGAESTSAAGGPSASAGSAAVSQCANVNCESIPASCKRIVQGPGDCCPTCPDTGCGPCPTVDCVEGTHSQTAPGDCCATCVADPPDACVEGLERYADLRAQLLDKYASSPCKNSTECTLLKEDNACGYACNIALPTLTAHNLLPNLDNDAQSCATCEPPVQVDCAQAVAGCVNGKCIAVEAQP